MSEASKLTQSSSKRYALSFQMKYGEVLHLENITKEEKDKYLEFVRKENATVLVEDKNTLRNLHSADIARVSVVGYDLHQDETSYRVKKMLYSESSLGRGIFKGMIKLYIAVAVLGIIGFFGIAMVENGLFDIFLKMDKFLGGFTKGLEFSGMIFKIFSLILLLMAFLDIALGYNAKYFRNQDGEEPPMTTRISNLTLVVAFMVVMMGIRLVFGIVM